MSDDNKIFSFEEKIAEPKVVRPAGVRKKPINPDPKYSIDEKEFEPIVVDSDIIEPPSLTKKVDRDKARAALEELVQETIKRKEERKDYIENQIKPSKDYSDEQSFTPDDSLSEVLERKPQPVPVFNNNIIDPSITEKAIKSNDDIAARLKANAILAMSEKQFQLEEEVSPLKSVMQNVLRVAFFPFYNPKRKKKNEISGIANNKKSENMRKELEAMVVYAKQMKIEKAKQEESFRKKLHEERKNKVVSEVAVDNADHGIEIKESGEKPAEIIKENKEIIKDDKIDFII